MKPVFTMSRIRTHTPAGRGRVSGPGDRRRRDEAGEKLYGLYKRSVEARRETGVESGPFQVKDWMK